MYVLLNPRSTLSYVTLYIAIHFSFGHGCISDSFSAITLMDESIMVRKVYRSFVVSICGKDTLVDLKELDMLDFGVILEINWLHSCYNLLIVKTEGSVSNSRMNR